LLQEGNNELTERSKISEGANITNQLSWQISKTHP